MKKEWKKPELEVLDVNMTMHNVRPGTVTDQDFPAHTPIDQLRYS